MARRTARTGSEDRQSARRGAVTWRFASVRLRLWRGVRSCGAGHPVLLFCVLAGVLLAAGVVLHRPGAARAQNGGAAAQAASDAAAACESAAALRAEGQFVEALQALAVLDEDRLSRKDRARYAAEMAAIMEAVRKGSGAGSASDALALVEACLVQTQLELAQAYLVAGKFDAAMGAANAAAANAPEALAASVEPLREEVAGAWYSAESDELVRLAEEKGSERAAYDKALAICATLDAWDAPRLQERKTETLVRWARKTVVRLADEDLFEAALDVLEANRPATSSDPMWLAPVVRAEAIDERNVAALVAVWHYAYTNAPLKLLHRQTLARAGEVPVDASPLQGLGQDSTGTAWSAVAMLNESGGNGQAASELIARLYENNAVPPNYEIQAEFSRLYAEYQCQRFESAVASADRLLAISETAKPDALRAAGTLPTAATFFKFQSLVRIGRADEARAVAARMTEQWPDDRMTATARQWLDRNERGDVR